ncbi:MAG: transposase [Thermodesulforhabdaceae bacterium]
MENRPVKEEYFALYVDATFLNVRRGSVGKEPVYVVVGINWDGAREVLGFWFFGSKGESATNWQEILGELKSRGLKRFKLLVADGLKGLKKAVLMEFPGTRSQLCVLHAVKGALIKESPPQPSPSTGREWKFPADGEGVKILQLTGMA